MTIEDALIVSLRDRAARGEEFDARTMARVLALLDEAKDEHGDLGRVAGALQSMMTMLAVEVTDPGAAKNYVELTMQWDKEIAARLPFSRVAVTFFREGGKSPDTQRREAVEDRDEVIAQRDGLADRLDAAEKHIARHWPARGSTLGDMTRREELEHDVSEAAKEWRPGQFFVADLVEAVDALIAFEAETEEKP
jgi:hypothetical protein